MSTRRFSRVAWGVLAYNMLVVLWGAFVRATGSGAGCGNRWPLCNGVMMPRAPRIETVIEFTHRATSGLALLSVTALCVWAFRLFPRGHRARMFAVLSVVFLFAEALLGAGLVLFQYVEHNASAGRTAYLSAHLVNTQILLAMITLTAWFGGDPISRRWRGAPKLAIAALPVAIVVSVSGAIAALGDTLFPATSLGSALAQDFSATSGWLVRWRWTHPTVAFLSSIFLIWILVRAARRSAHWDNRGLSALVLVLLAAQYVLGVMDVFMLAPLWLQVAHLLGADVLWVALVVLTARLTLQPVEAR